MIQHTPLTALFRVKAKKRMIIDKVHSGSGLESVDAAMWISTEGLDGRGYK